MEIRGSSFCYKTWGKKTGNYSDGSRAHPHHLMGRLGAKTSCKCQHAMNESINKSQGLFWVFVAASNAACQATALSLTSNLQLSLPQLHRGLPPVSLEPTQSTLEGGGGGINFILHTHSQPGGLRVLKKIMLLSWTFFRFSRN